jgi:hypothetical protein
MYDILFFILFIFAYFYFVLGILKILEYFFIEDVDINEILRSYNNLNDI